jgi:hypothetical protein
LSDEVLESKSPKNVSKLSVGCYFSRWWSWSCQEPCHCGIVFGYIFSPFVRQVNRLSCFLKIVFLWTRRALRTDPLFNRYVLHHKSWLVRLLQNIDWQITLFFTLPLQSILLIFFISATTVIILNKILQRKKWWVMKTHY